MSWNDRYLEDDIPWDQGAASQVALRALELAVGPPARVLVPGCGRAWEVEAIADRGYHAVGLDVAPTALELAAARIGPRTDVELVAGDLLDPPAALLGAFDAVVEHTCYCAVGPDHWAAYVAQTARLLRPGGAVAGAFLHFEGGGPPWGTHPEELRGLFEPTFRLERLETWPEPFAPLGEPQLLVVARRA